MRLDKAFLELNQMAEEVKESVYKIYTTYIDSEEKFPYGTVQSLINKYELVRDKLYKKKNSVVNEFWGSISTKRKENLDKLSALDGYQILNQVSEIMISQILENANNYIPCNEKDKMEIFDKLFPIMMNLSPFRIAEIYRQMKTSVDNLDDNKAALLQKNFVEHIVSVLSHNSANKYNRVCRYFTYEEVCRNILKEPVLFLDSVNKKSSR